MGIQGARQGRSPGAWSEGKESNVDQHQKCELHDLDRPGDARHAEAPDPNPALPAERPRIPFSWMVSYDGRKARRNIAYFEHGARNCRHAYPVHVFMSALTPAVVISFVPLNGVREPHVREWFASYHEIPVEEAKRRLDAYPEWPYDGRDADIVRAEQLNDPHYHHHAMLERAREKQVGMGG